MLCGLGTAGARNAKSPLVFSAPPLIYRDAVLVAPNTPGFQTVIFPSSPGYGVCALSICTRGGRCLLGPGLVLVPQLVAQCAERSTSHCLCSHMGAGVSLRAGYGFVTSWLSSSKTCCF